MPCSEQWESYKKQIQVSLDSNLFWIFSALTLLPNIKNKHSGRGKKVKTMYFID